MTRRSAIAVFALALVTRLAYLAQIRGLPWFDVPIVDGANYARLARVIASGDLLGGRGAFWQPPLYSYFLALLFRLAGPRMALVYVAQAALGALTCLLTARLGARLGGRRCGLLAGLIAAFYGPLVHFDEQPLIPVLHVLLVVAGLVAMLRAAEGGPAGTRRWAGAGLLWGLAAIATPNILSAAPVAALWARRRGSPRAAGALLGALALPVLLVAARNLAMAGEPVLISSNGGINFYIGNNPDYDRTIRIRPGGEFERLEEEASNAGVVGASATSRWFAGRALSYLAGYPASGLRLYLRKARDLVAGREIPRNENIYEYRRVSWILAALVWRLGLSFPFGVVAPLAFAGAWARFQWRRARPASSGPAVSAEPDAGAGRRIPGPATLLLGTAGAYALSVLLFFPTDRYRLPLVPIAVVFAARLLSLPGAWRRPAVLGALAAGFVLFNLDAATASESWPEEWSLNRAYALRAQGRRDEARAEYRRAVEQNPARLDPRNALAVMAAEDGDWAQAETRYREVLALAPEFVDVRRSLGEALQAEGRAAEARREWDTALHLAPRAGLVLADLALSYLQEGALEPAYDAGRRAAAARPDLPETRMAYGLAARAMGRREEALRELREAERLFPEGSPGGRQAREALERLAARPAAAGGG